MSEKNNTPADGGYTEAEIADVMKIRNCSELEAKQWLAEKGWHYRTEKSLRTVNGRALTSNVTVAPTPKAS